MYMRNVLIPAVFTDNLLNDYNYIIGSRFTVKLVELQDNQFTEYEQAVPRVRSNPAIDPFKSNDNEFTEEILSYEYDHGGGFRHAGGYVLFLAHKTKDEALLD